jgi:hypothetical protein
MGLLRIGNGAGPVTNNVTASPNPDRAPIQAAEAEGSSGILSLPMGVVKRLLAYSPCTTSQNGFFAKWLYR